MKGGNTIQRIIAIQRISNSKTFSVIHRIEIYSVDTVIQSSNNRGLVIKVSLY